MLLPKRLPAKFTPIFASIFAICTSGAAMGQFFPPDPGPAPVGGPTATAPSNPTAPSISIIPPSGAPAAAPPAPSGTYVPQSNDSFTANALLGYVSDHPIFAGDLWHPIDDQLRQAAVAAAGNIMQFQTRAIPLLRSRLERRKEDIIVVTAAEAILSDNDKTGIDLQLNKTMADLRTKYGGSEAKAAAYLQSTGSSLEQYKNEQRDELVIGIYFMRKLRPLVSVTGPMVRDYYDRHLSDYQIPAKVDLYTITLPVQRWLHADGTDGQEGALIENPTAEQIKAAEARAMSVGRDIIRLAREAKDKDSGATFARLVQQYDSRDTAADTGGRWIGGAVESSFSNPALKSYVFSVPANSVAAQPLLLHDNDFRNSTVMVVKIGEKSPAHTRSFNEASLDIYNKLIDQALTNLQASEVERLVDNAPVERVDDMLGVALDATVARYMHK